MPTRSFAGREMEYLQQVLQSGKLSGLSGGEFTGRFERAFADSHGAKHGVAMNCAMSVLHASVIAAGAGAGDEVLCDPICVFGAVAVMYNNAVPVFVDVNPITWNMDPDCIEAKITDRTKALIVTHVCGLAAEMDRIVEIAHKHGLIVIEDCAHAILCKYDGKYVGTWGDIGSFSFQSSKQMGLGDGGMATTNRDDLAEQLALHAGAPTFAAMAHGLHYNYRITESTAAIGLAQMDVIQGYIDGIIRVADIYDQAVADCDWITLQRGPEKSGHTFHIWGANFMGADVGISRDDFAKVLAEEGCGVNLGYTDTPAYAHPLIADRMGFGRGCPLDCPLYEGTQNQYPAGSCPVAESVFPRIIFMGTFLPEDAAQSQADALRRAIDRLS